jgi:uncharacterized membrane protein YeaQ/YmgE (transglycosylase-associated protein family)
VVNGLAGSLVGGFLLERFGIDLGIRNQTASRIATSIIGAMGIVLLACHRVEAVSPAILSLGARR